MTTNQAFIDGQNFYRNTKTWQIDLFRFRRYLREKYGVAKAYYFLGAHEKERSRTYKLIETAGFILVFREHSNSMLGKKKGNVDTDIVFTIMAKLIDDQELGQIILVSGDGDYFKMVQYLVRKRRFYKLLAPDEHSVSSLYRRLPTCFIDILSVPHVRRLISR